MEISRYGQSTMRLVSGDVALIADPNLEESEGSDAEIVLVSADATDNVSRRVTEEGPRVIRGPGQYEVRGYNITGIGTALRDEEGSCRINTVYVIRAEGLSVCHLGQLNSKLTARQLDSSGRSRRVNHPFRRRGQPRPQGDRGADKRPGSEDRHSGAVRSGRRGRSRLGGRSP